MCTMLSTLSNIPEFSVRHCSCQKNWKPADGWAVCDLVTLYGMSFRTCQRQGTKGIQSWVRIKLIVTQKVRQTNSCWEGDTGGGPERDVVLMASLGPGRASGKGSWVLLLDLKEDRES